MIKVILFDVDGVLVNGYSFSGRLARDYGITQEATVSFFKGRFGECLVGKADLKEEIEGYLPKWGWQGSVDDFLNEWFATEQSIDETLVDAIQWLRQRGIRCYLATNQEKYRTAYLLDQMGFERRFDGIFSSVYVGYMKHDTAFFEHVLRELKNVKARESLFWDDQPGNVATATVMDLLAVLYSDFADFEKTISCYSSLTESLSSVVSG